MKLEEKEVQVKGMQSGEFFKLPIPDHYIGFLNYLNVDGLPTECFADGEKIKTGVLLKPPYLVRNHIACFGENKEGPKKVKIKYGLEVYFDIYGGSPIAPEKKEEKIVKVDEKKPIYSHIINHNLNEPNKWYEIKLEPDIVTWQLRARGSHELSYAFDPAHANYMTMDAGEKLSEDTVPNRDINAIYVMCPDTGVVVEMEIWRFEDKYA